MVNLFISRTTALGEASATLEYAWYRALWFEDQFGEVLPMRQKQQQQLVKHYERSNSHNGYWLH